MQRIVQRAAQAAVRVSGIERGLVSAAVDPAALHHGALGIVLDGELTDTVAPPARRRSPLAFTYALTGMRLARTLDFAHLGTGERLLDTPVDLTPLVGPRFDRLAFDGVTLSGRFTLGWRPHPFLSLALQDETQRVVARCVARVASDDGYDFACTLDSLPAGRLTPVIGGLALPDAELAASCPLVGYVDGVAEDAVTGWLTDSRAVGPVHVEARFAGGVIASVLADQDRPDVAQARQDTRPFANACGFRLVIPQAARMRGAGSIDVVVAGTTTGLHNSPAFVEPLAPRMNHLDVVRGGVVEGWAIDGDIDGPVPVEVRQDGIVLASGLANLFREDLRLHGLRDGCCMFRIRIGPEHGSVVGQSLEVRAAGHPIAGSPAIMQPSPGETRFLARRSRVGPALLPRLRTRLDRLAGRRSVSLVMPVFGPAPGALETAIDSVLGQWCTRWELLCVADNFSDRLSARLLARYAQRESRIRIVPSSRDAGQGAAWAAGFAAARSGHVALLDPAQALEPDAVYHLLRAIRDTDPDMLSTDSYVGEPEPGRVDSVRAHAAFSYDRFLAAPYWPDLLCLRTSLARSLPPVAGVELAIAAVERAATVAHVPAIALRHRAPGVLDGLPAVREHLARAHPRARAEPGEAPGQVRVVWPRADRRVLSIVHGRAASPELERALSARGQVVRLPGPTAAALDEAAAGSAETLLFVDGEAASDHPDWIDRLLALVARPGVAAAGPTLLRPDGTVLASGLVLGASSIVRASAPKPALVRDVSAIPLAALAVDASLFRAAGGFDPAMGSLADIDLCLRLAQAGGKILLDGTVMVTVAETALPTWPESGPFFARHAKTLVQGDLWYSPLLSATGDWTVQDDAACAMPAIRVIRAVAPAAAPKQRRSVKATAI